MSVVVVNASPLISLARIDKFILLKHLFSKIIIPNAVWEEVVVQGAGKPAADLVVQAEQLGWLSRQPVQDVLAVMVLQANLGDGESEAIVLAQELQADWVLLDDGLARSHAIRLNLPVKGTAGILLTAYHAGFVADLQTTFDELRSHGFRLSDYIYNSILAQIDKSY